MINPVTGWFEITKYNNGCVITIANLVETTCLIRYSCLTEIMHEKVSELSGHDFKQINNWKRLKYTSQVNRIVNPTYNAILEQINQVLGNLCVLITLNIPM